MKKSLKKILVWTISCGLALLVILFSIKKAFATPAPDTCQTELPATKSIEPLWESLSHQFVSRVSIY